MEFFDTWVTVWTTFGSLAVILLTVAEVWSYILRSRAPDPVPGLLEVIRDLTEIRDEQRGFRNDLRDRFDTLEARLRGAQEAEEARLQILLEALAAHRRAFEEGPQALAETLGDRLERIEEELRRLSAQSERDVVRPVVPGEWCTLM